MIDLTIEKKIEFLKQCKKIYITKAAEKQIKFLIKKSSSGIGIRINLKKTGCAGFKYTLEIIKDKCIKKDEKEIFFLKNGFNIFVPIKIIPFLIDTKIDFIKKGVNWVFKFKSSKIKEFCGCGESFNI
ncbi:iron-sulfur cluster assembly accessory protein [Buchnera aphidicola (Mindarus keteleerifoliae)]|uniref:iron-sulfur cluster assembly accessory protein n=1 Tax=Buchnera aphidicola TaxID=9 RepID=UPI0031B70C1D